MFLILSEYNDDSLMVAGKGKTLVGH